MDQCMLPRADEPYQHEADVAITVLFNGAANHAHTDRDRAALTQMATWLRDQKFRAKL